LAAAVGSCMGAGRGLGTCVVAWVLFDLGSWGLLHMVEEIVEPVSRR
jgi:hypothetical protein